MSVASKEQKKKNLPNLQSHSVEKEQEPGSNPRICSLMRHFEHFERY